MIVTTKQMQPAVEVNSVSKTFILPHETRNTLKENVINVFKKRTYENFRALDDVNISIGKGEFVGIVGKNGSGKSTLLKIIAGIYKPCAGEVKIHGDIAPFLELGIGFQDDLTARENIFINGTLLGLTRAEIKNRFESIVTFSGIGNFLDLKIKNFSSGMRARLAFAIAREADAQIYLCDELLAVGDEQFQEKCMEVFRRWKAEGKTILLVSHNPQIISDFCTRAVLLDHGKIVAEGLPDAVLDQYHQKIKFTPG
jgi:lipopolysaccharide transport system ATP-binding protein